MNFTQFIINGKTVFTLSFIISGLLLLLCYTDPVSAEVQIGKVIFARGAVSAQTTGGLIRLLGKDAAIYRTDTIDVSLYELYG